jgi:DNA-binding transcriptional MocR family regulator
MVVPGALAGVAIATRALVRPGDRVVLESPTYPNAIATLRHGGARLVGADVGREDAEVESVVAAARQVRPRVAYLIPDFHNPTGHLLGDESRERVARTLAGTSTTAIVDESMVALALDGQEMPRPFAAYSPDAVSVGSLSKPFWGGLRVGWIRAPQQLVPALFAARLSLDLGVPLLEQLVATELLRTGGDLLEHRRAQLRASRTAVLEALAENLPDWRVRPPGGGLNVWCELPVARSSALLPHAAARDVLLAAGPAFAPEGGLDRFLRIPYTQPAHVLRDAVARIAEAWAEAAAGPRRGRGDATCLVA